MSSIRHKTVFRGLSPALFVKLVVLTVISAGLMLTGPAAQTAPAAEDAAKIKPKLSRQLEAKGEASFWIRFDQADLSSASKISDWTERGQVVYDTLKAAASESQKDTRTLLDGEDVTYQAFWATNAIRVEAGDPGLALKIAGSSDVVALYPTFDYRLEKPIKGKPVHGVDAVEWGVANINADDVWSQFGVTGEGITVASIDTGTQFDHAALVDQYRGNNGDGTFDHNYNWFDAAGSCPDAPCDNNGHGTHTMGTMLGDDGGENQIGVAPGANWIEANGCCPSDAALIASGEWMLAPTNLAGENADVSKRPNIINNSWGTQPSNDPFMEDIQLAWAASGIWGQWSNGNSGSACETSGSPGSRIINYSSGAYDINNQIADFSSRGPGQDGEIKPNISAPGVNVRSSFPGNTYGSISGTSMASPHVAGAVALLWSAAPALIGDIEGTWALLDGTSADTEDAQCGGTADDNNVWGEGRLDALALVSAAPVGDTGTLAGTVTDSATGDPLADATVEITGEFNRTVTTEDDGSYSVRLSAGDYTATASQFGYGNESADVTVAPEQTTTQDFALTVSPSVTLSGTVTDGSGHGWPLYAAIDVAGPGADVYTDPVTGDYSVSLPSNATYMVTVDSQYPGYTPATFDVTIGDGDATQDAALEVDSASCTAAGYEVNVNGVTEDFNAGALPDGWTMQDNVGDGQVWQFDDPGERENLTGGDGGFAIVDSDFYGDGSVQDTALVSPVVDMSALTAPVVGFRQDYNNLGDVADVDLSIDGGATWTTVLHQTTDVRGPRQDIVELPAAAGQAEVQVRFHYYDAEFAWWWEVDDVFVGNRTCDPIQGGLVVGNVRDARTSEGINGATVTSVDKPAETATSMGTPDDAALDDGFYWTFSTLTGRHPFKAEANQYTAATAQVDVDRNDAMRADFSLSSGHLTVTPTSLAATARLGGSPKSKSFVVTNDGEATVNVELGEKSGGFVIQKADGSRMSRKAMLADEGAPLKVVHGTFSPLSQAAAGGRAKGKAPAATAPHEDPWTTVADYPESTMDAGATTVEGLLYSFGGTSGDDIVPSAYVYDPVATAWSPIAEMPDGRENPAVAAIDGVIYISGGWLPDGTPTTSTLAYDPSSDSYTEVADQPVGAAAPGRVVLDGLMYLVGGCQDTCGLTDVQVYDPAADSWSQVADYPEDTSHVACGAIDGQLYCAGGTATGTSTHTFVYDPGADSWSPLADLPIDLWGMGYTAANGMLLVSGGVTDEFNTITNQGFAYDPGSDSWTALPNSNNTLYRGGSACGLYRVGGSTGGFSPVPDVEVLPGMDDCEVGADVEWLEIDTTSATLEPGDSVRVTVTMDPNVAQPGVYTAGVSISDDAPGSAGPVSVALTVTPPPAWGKLRGTVSGVSCTGATAPLAGATLQVDSWAGSWTFTTGSDGGYAYWFNVRHNPLQLIAAKDGYKPQTKKVRLVRGTTVTGNFALKKNGC